MRKHWMAGIGPILLVCLCLILSSCTNLEEGMLPEQKEIGGTDSAQTASVSPSPSASALSCKSYEVEAEPGVCSYAVECLDAAACEEWSEWFIVEMEQWFGDLVYAEEWEVDEEESELEPEAVVSYSVDEGTLGLEPANEDEEYYAWLWDRFTWVIPSDQRTMIARFEVFDHADTMAYVVQDEEDYESWTYAANQVQATYETERVFTDIHEFGHLLALNADQVDPYSDAGQCTTYMVDEGCANEDSYIYHFYKQFWMDGSTEDGSDYVSEYAMSDLYEDFAESWAYFVLTGRPENQTLADSKVNFFYVYDELILLKADLLGRTASWLERQTAETG
ncbi:hypothetical protein ACX93W_27015 [Paenibacillus sp. CAU 1782]